MAASALDEPVSRIALSISCKGLANLDTLSKSDPCVYVFLDGVAIGHTEMIRDNLNPTFAKSFPIEYRFEQVQKLRFMVVDVDDVNKGWQQQDQIGELETTVANIVGSRTNSVTADLVPRGKRAGTSKKVGQITVVSEEESNNRELYTLRMAAHKLDNLDFFSKSDPFLVISKSTEGGAWVKVHQTEVKKNDLSPRWNPITITADKLCGGDKLRTLRFEVFDYDSPTSADLIGVCEASMADLFAKRRIDVINPKKQAKKRSYKNSGELFCEGVEVEMISTFMDYLQGGLQLNFMTSIDFTGSNGNPSNPKSLHYHTPYQMNQYETAIRCVGDIIAAYDWDGKFPVYGFGAKLPNGQVEHCFPLNGNAAQPEVAGVEGIVSVYKHALTNCKLYGPTNFAPSIITAASIAQQFTGASIGTAYMVLLILTDGVITDAPATIDAIVDASDLPLSIIIIGVGEADFDQMDVLDSDEKRLRSSAGKFAVRDIVQFVPFREFASRGPAALAAEVLRELPAQVEGFFKAKKVAPRPPPPRP